MNRKTLSLVAASIVVAGALGAQPAKPVAKKAAPAMAAAAPTVAPVATPAADTTHKKLAAKKAAKKVAKAKRDSTAKHDSTTAAPKKHKGN